VILYGVKRLIQKEVFINLLLGLLALSHLRLIPFPFSRLLELAGITVEVFLPASTQGPNIYMCILLSLRSNGYKKRYRGNKYMSNFFLLQSHFICNLYKYIQRIV
jgi:hypothetical protein